LKRWKWLTATFGIALCVSSCGPDPYDYGREPDPRKHEFVLGVEDCIRINVWNNPQLGTEGCVRPDGVITMPLIGDILVVGRTPSQLKADISERLSAYVKDESAVVTVAVTALNSLRFTCSGNFERPNINQTKSYVTVCQAVSLCGGINKFCNPSRLVLKRKDAHNKTRAVPVDFNRACSGEHPEQELVMTPGDTIYCP
jgi:polysaccharide export outer membrane protein